MDSQLAPMFLFEKFYMTKWEHHFIAAANSMSLNKIKVASNIQQRFQKIISKHSRKEYVGGGSSVNPSPTMGGNGSLARVKLSLLPQVRSECPWPRGRAAWCCEACRWGAQLSGWVDGGIFGGKGACLHIESTIKGETRCLGRFFTASVNGRTHQEMK